ncbi:MAG TPA: STAS domain-containing protein [Bacteroidota bacterium]|nr:STAS domain-containing protein [Bacteroidota bacterium]
MNILTKKVGGFDVVTLEGDFLTEPEQNDFRTIVRNLVTDGAKHLIVNLTAIRHVNSCGLGSMVCALVMMKKSGGDVRFVGINKDVGKILEITHLDRVLQVYAGINEAIQGQFAFHN